MFAGTLGLGEGEGVQEGVRCKDVGNPVKELGGGWAAVMAGCEFGKASVVFPGQWHRSFRAAQKASKTLRANRGRPCPIPLPSLTHKDSIATFPAEFGHEIARTTRFLSYLPRHFL